MCYLWLAHPSRDKIFISNGWIIYHAFFYRLLFIIDELIDNVDTFFLKKYYSCLDTWPISCDIDCDSVNLIACFQKWYGFQTANIPQQIASNLSSFNFGDIKNESSIAKVGYGFAYKATYKNKLQASP